jgi:hypothetical protein
MTEPRATAQARAFAARHRVDLSRFRASDPAVGVTCEDILADLRSRREAAESRNWWDLRADAAAGRNVVGRAIAAGVIQDAERSQHAARCVNEPGYQQALEERIAAAEPALARPGVGLRASAGGGARGPAADVNPLVAEIARSRPALFAVASAEGPPPTLFVSGDLPPFVASGDERVRAALPRIPWQARHAVAGERDGARALAIVEDVSGPDGEVAASAYAGHPGVREYERRVKDWARGPAGLSQYDRQGLDRADADAMAAVLYDDLFPPDRGAR